MVLESADVQGFLTGLARLAATHLDGADEEVFCGITLLRPRRAETVAASSDRAAPDAFNDRDREANGVFARKGPGRRAGRCALPASPIRTRT